MRLTADQNEQLLTWLEEHEDWLYPARVGMTLAYNHAISDNAFYFSQATFSRVALYARCCGRLRKWQGTRGRRGDTVGQTLLPFGAAGVVGN